MREHGHVGGDPWGDVAQDVQQVEPDAFDESEPVPATTVTLVEGACFAICDLGGDVENGVEGLFVGDTRICSRMQVSVDGSPIEPLTLAVRSPSSATFVGRTRDRRLLVFRDVWVGQGMRVDLRIRNLMREPRATTIRVAFAADLAELFAVKRGAAPAMQARPRVDDEERLRFADPEGRRGLLVSGSADPVPDDGALEWRIELPACGSRDACVQMTALRDDQEVPPMYPCGRPAEQLRALNGGLGWRRDLPHVTTDVPGLGHAVARAADDLAALRLVDPDHPEDLLVAAGAPWYMTLFGRDSLLTSWMALPLDPNLALGTVRSLARMQGTRDDPETEEQPGRILHEVRFARGASLRLADGDVYYGTVDATPLFVMLVHELWRWGASASAIDELRPAVDAALGWMERGGDADGDGYLEYGPVRPPSLVNQGWKDSHDAVSFSDGRLAEPPIALAEAQAYAYAALRAGAALAAAAGHEPAAADRRARAERLRENFERDFWLPDRDAYAIALDRDKRPVDAIASNMGHLLWAGIVTDPERAAAIARHLTSPELFTGWGIRTLATSMARYNPLAYHNGSVWPHDTAICAAGLRRAGFVEESHLVARGLLAAADALGGRLPELFAGLTDEEMPVPVRYPTSCSPQAWASAAPLLLLRTMLGLEPDVPRNEVQLDPDLPDGSSTLNVDDLPLAGLRVGVEVADDALAVRGLPRGLALMRPGG